MKNLIVILVSATFLLAGCKSQDPAVKAAKEAEEQLLFVQAVEALNTGEFVLEADRVNGKTGRSVNVSPSTNFVAMTNEKAIVQLALSPAFAGPNGLGGITVEGNPSNVKINTDKKGNVSYRMHVTGAAISATVDIDLRAGGNYCMATVSPNFNSQRITFTGYLYPKSASNIFKGRSF